MDTCAQLAEAQLLAYNAKDLELFCRCYSDDVRVLDASGGQTLRGMVAFRERYGALFGDWQVVGARVDTRLECGPHTIDDETWWRSRTAPNGTIEQASGRVLVRYTARNGRITEVQFFREDT